MSGIRVALVSHYYPPHLGGLEVVVQEEAHRLAERGAEVTVVTSAWGAPGGAARDGKVVVRRVRAWSGLERAGVPFPVFSPMLLAHLWATVRRADIVHIHDTLYISSWVAAVCCRLLRRRYVVTQHVGLVDHPSRVVRLAQHAVRRTLSRFVTGKAAALLPISTYVAADSPMIAPVGVPVTVLPNGVDVNHFRPAVAAGERAAIRQTLGLPLDERLVLYVGRFVPKKGFDLLAGSAGAGYRVVFVGGDRPRGVTDPRHIFLGRLDPDEVARVYRAVDLFVSASVGECPLTVLEAMASGVPVLLNDDPGHRGLGLPRDAAAWGDLRGGDLPGLLAAQLDDEQALRRLARHGRAAAERAFSWDAHVDRLSGVYESLLRPGGHRTRVAVVTPHYAPRVGGVESYTASLVRALRDSDRHEVVVVTTSGSRRTVTEQRDGVLVVRLGAWFTVSNTPVNPLWLLRLPLLLRRLRVDVVNAHAPVPVLADVAAVAVRRTPVVLTYHAGSMVKGVGGAVDRLLRGYERWVLPRVVARADRVVAVSPVAAALTGAGAAVVPPGVDTARFGYEPERAGGRVLYVGRIEQSSRWKGLPVLVRAFAQVLAEHPDAELHLVGSGDDVAGLAALADRLGCAGSLVWHGPLTGDALVAAYHDCSVVVLPSLTESESFGITLVEAMACGRPVVGSDVGGIRFVVCDDVEGLLAPPGDPRALARTLVGLLADAGLRTRLGRAGRAAAEQRWDQQRTTAQLLDILRSADRAAVDTGGTG